MRRGPLLAAALLTLGSLLGLVAPAVAAVPTADEPEPAVRIVIDSLAPAIPQQDDLLRIRGRVISNSRETLTDVSVQLRRSSAPISTDKALTAAFEAGLDPADGEPADVPLPGTRSVVAQELPPGSRRPFSIRISMSALGLTSSGAYVLGVDALGRETGVDEFDVRKGAVRTFLPWFPDGTDVAPIDLVWLWPLADWPARSVDGVLLNTQTPQSLADGGRLDRLVAIGDRFRSTVSWLADPALLQTVAQMTQGYQVLQDGNLVVGDREQDAATWLASVSSIGRTTSMRSMPYADVDASAVTRGDMSNDVVRAVTQGPGIATAALGTPVPGDLYWAPFGRIDRPTLNVLGSAGVTTLVLSADAMPPTDDTTPTDGLATAALPTSVGTIRAVLVDPRLARTLALPQRSANDVIAARQRFLAQTAVLAQSLPEDQASRVFVVGPTDVRWTATASLLAPLLRATRSAPWLSPLTLEQLLESPAPSASRQRGGYGQKARDAELPADYVARIASTSAELDVFTSVIDNPTGITEPFSEALLRAESAGWRTEPEVGNTMLASIRARLAEETARVRVLSEGTITFSGDSGKVPITIANDLDRSVTVGLVLRGRPSLRLSSEPLAGIRIEPGKFASVDIDARVVGGDPLNVAIQLLSPEGADYGQATNITVTSTAYARAAAWVVVAAFVAIVVFVIVGVARRIHAARSSASGAPSGNVEP